MPHGKSQGVSSKERWARSTSHIKSQDVEIDFLRSAACQIVVTPHNQASFPNQGAPMVCRNTWWKMVMLWRQCLRVNVRLIGPKQNWDLSSHASICIFEKALCLPPRLPDVGASSSWSHVSPSLSDSEIWALVTSDNKDLDFRDTRYKLFVSLGSEVFAELDWNI